MTLVHSPSLAGLFLMGLGLVGLTLGRLVCRPSDYRALLSANRADVPPGWRVRLWVHLFGAGGWSLAFGFIVILGPPSFPWDVRLPGEASWTVWPESEYIYVCGYVTPLLIAWIPRSRGGLLRVAWVLVLLTAASVALFLLLPIAAPPRPLVPSSLAGRLLAWETSRPDFAAASFPSFHALWAILLAQACSDQAGRYAVAGWAWAALMSVVCVANGAHALADVVASWVLYLAVAACPLPSRLRSARRPRSNGNFPGAQAQAAEQKTRDPADC